MNHPLHKLIELCREDLARQLQLELQNVDFVTANVSVWNDASMGISDGLFYPQKPFAGYRIVVRANDKNYQYHTDAESTIRQFKVL